jgi:hypothetical protein
VKVSLALRHFDQEKLLMTSRLQKESNRSRDVGRDEAMS